jgi:hypothetical protein
MPADAAAPSPANRIDVGCDLLARFFSDGRIRGLTPAGQLYDHRVAAGLTERFARGFDAGTLRGTS